jgi:predicted nucleic acid-binding protein
MMSEAFLDSAYAISLACPNDQHHSRAMTLADEMLRDRTRLVTTRAVMLEIGNALARLRHRSSAIALLDALESDSHVEIVSLSEELYAEGVALFAQSQDKEWGVTDCISFVLMRQRRGVRSVSGVESPLYRRETARRDTDCQPFWNCAF